MYPNSTHTLNSAEEAGFELTGSFSNGQVWSNRKVLSQQASLDALASPAGLFLQTCLHASRCPQANLEAAHIDLPCQDPFLRAIPLCRVRARFACASKNALWRIQLEQATGIRKTVPKFRK
jgi:hypothetical protein